MRLKFPLTAAIAAAVGLSLTGCAGSSGGGSSDSTLTVAELSAPISLDPANAANGNQSLWYVTPAYAPLIAQDDAGDLVPGMAASWKYLSNDNRIFEVTLKHGLKFADGSPVDANAVVQSILHYKGGRGPGSGFFADIDVKADGTDKVVLTSSEPNPLMPNLLTAKWAGGIISPAGLANPEKLAHETYGAGPYKLDAAQSVTDDHYTYVPNKNYYDKTYWAGSKDHFQKIVIRVIPQVNAELQALQSGQIDVMYSDVPTAESATKSGNRSLAIAHKPVSWDGIYLMDIKGIRTPALKDVRVRQALNYAVDRAAIVKAVYGDYGTPNGQPNTPGDESYGYDPDLNKLYNYDPEKAKKLLDEAGYPGGFTLPALYRGLPGEPAMMQAVASQLADVGVKVKLKSEPDTGALVNDLASQAYSASAGGASGKPVPLALGGAFLEHGIYNPFNAVDPKVQEANDALLAGSPEEQSKLAKAAMRVTVEQALSVPIASIDDIFIYNKDSVSGVEFMTGANFLKPIESWQPKG